MHLISTTGIPIGAFRFDTLKRPSLQESDNESRFARWSYAGPGSPAPTRHKTSVDIFFAEATAQLGSGSIHTTIINPRLKDPSLDLVSSFVSRLKLAHNLVDNCPASRFLRHTSTYELDWTLSGNVPIQPLLLSMVWATLLPLSTVRSNSIYPVQLVVR